MTLLGPGARGLVIPLLGARFPRWVEGWGNRRLAHDSTNRTELLAQSS